MQQTSLPSKQFLIRGGIAIGIVSLILIFQTDWFWGLFGKKAPRIDPEQTIGQTVGKDSNGNGIPDWEERLFGLDPTVLYTGDMSNKEIIENKKKALGLNANGDEGPLNESDRIARQLFSIGISLGQEGASLDDIGAAGDALGASTSEIYVANHYTFKNIKTTTTTKASLLAYQNKVESAISRFSTIEVDTQNNLNEIENGDYEAVPKVTIPLKQYQTISQEIAAIPVPVPLAQHHLNLINAIYGMGESLSYLALFDNDPIVGLKGLSLYRDFSFKYDMAVDELGTLLLEYGILQ